MKRPLLFILMFLIFGILISIYITNIYIKIILFLIIFILSLYFSKIYKIKFPRYLIIFTFIGYFLVLLNSTSYYINEKDTVNIIGYVKTIEKSSNDKYKFKVSTTHINNKSKNLNILVYNDTLSNIKLGSKISVDGKIYYPNKKSNPNAYNEELNFKIDKINYKLYANNIKILKHNKFKVYLSNLKDNICNIYDR